jgi:hypothetical protein
VPLREALERLVVEEKQVVAQALPRFLAEPRVHAVRLALTGDPRRALDEVRPVRLDAAAVERVAAQHLVVRAAERECIAVFEHDEDEPLGRPARRIDHACGGSVPHRIAVVDEVEQERTAPIGDDVRHRRAGAPSRLPRERHARRFVSGAREVALGR